MLFQEEFGLKEKKFVVSDVWTSLQSASNSFSVFEDKNIFGRGADGTDKDLFTIEVLSLNACCQEPILDMNN